jgi:putative endonuclease
VIGASRDRTGEIAEDLAVDFLRLHGYTVLARNYRYGKAELDVIVRMGTTVAFVEVKLRDAATVGPSPFEAVGPKKQEHMVKAAVHYAVTQCSRGVSLRFDVIGISWDRPGGSIQLVHLINAFQADSRYYY